MDSLLSYIIESDKVRYYEDLFYGPCLNMGLLWYTVCPGNERLEAFSIQGHLKDKYIQDDV